MDCAPYSSWPLPSEMTHTILSYLTDKEHFPKVRLVCQLWNQGILDLKSQELRRNSVPKPREFSIQSYAFLTRAHSISPYLLREFFAEISAYPHHEMIFYTRQLLREWKKLSISKKNPLILKEHIHTLNNHEACPNAMRFPLTEMLLAEFRDSVPSSSKKESEGVILEALPFFTPQKVSKEFMKQVEVGQNYKFTPNELVVVNEKENLLSKSTTLFFGVVLKERGEGYQILISNKEIGMISVLKDSHLIGKILNTPSIKSFVPKFS